MTGTILTRKIKSLGVGECGNCARLAGVMDLMGPDWCDEMQDYLVDEIEQNAISKTGVFGALSRLAQRNQWTKNQMRSQIHRLLVESIAEARQADGYEQKTTIDPVRNNEPIDLVRAKINTLITRANNNPL